jgi:hypothetical protein
LYGSPAREALMMRSSMRRFSDPSQKKNRRLHEPNLALFGLLDRCLERAPRRPRQPGAGEGRRGAAAFGAGRPRQFCRHNLLLPWPDTLSGESRARAEIDAMAPDSGAALRDGTQAGRRRRLTGRQQPAHGRQAPDRLGEPPLC